MAINVNIPGVGNIEVQGAAEETTMRELLRVMQSATTKTRRFETDLANSFKGIDSSADDAKSSMNSMASSARMASTSSSALYNQLQDQLTKSGSAVGELGSYALTFGHDLLATSSLITKEWTKAFNPTSMADPVATAAGTINAGLTLAGDAVGLFGGALGAAANALKGYGKLLKAAGLDAGKTAAGVLKVANEQLAHELLSSIKAMHEFAVIGGSFAGSIGEIRQAATDAHLNLDQFGKIVKTNRENLMMLGGNLAEASHKLANQMQFMDLESSENSKAIGTMRTFRNELRAMGYDVEEQGAVVSSYMAQLRSIMPVQEFQKLTAKEIAEGTRLYAADLKILAEFTGKDAKAIQEKARQESSRAILLSQLDAKQQEDFIKVSRSFAAFPPTVQTALQNGLTQLLAGGTITDPVIAGNEKAMSYLVEMAEKIRNGGVADMNVYSLERAALYKKQELDFVKMGQATQAATTSLGRAFTVSGVAGAQGKYFDELFAAMMPEPGAVERSRKSLEQMAQSQDPVTLAYLAAAQASQNFAVVLTDIASKILPAYSGLIADTTRITTDVIRKTLDAFSQQKFPEGKVITDMLKDIKESIGRMANNIPRRANGDVVNGTQLSWVGEAGPEAIIPLKNGTTIPVEFSSKPNSVDASGLNKQKNTMDSSEQLKLVSALPESISQAMNPFLSGPNGFISAVRELKSQFENSSNQQAELLQAQVQKLDSLVSAMEDNTRASEQIAYSMS